MSDATYTMNDLTASGCYALCYTQALVYGKDSPHGVRFEIAQRRLAQTMTGDDIRRALAAGLAELTELGIIECERDGHGDLVPKRLREDRIRAADARVIIGDAQ